MEIVKVEGGTIKEVVSGFKTLTINATVKDENGKESIKLIEIDLSTVNILIEK